MLLLNVGVLELEEIAVLDFLNTPVLVNVMVTQMWGVRGDCYHRS
jgi:hypothetical protein